VPELRQGCSAAFAVDGASGEQVVVVGEITQDGSVARDWGRILAAIRGAVSEVFGLALGSVSLIRPGTIPKTASGKVQRSKARDAFLKHELSLLHTWTARSIRQPG
jgi:acyl-CoA synthetase (AMP-forming)/AMP-acid ligase II